MFNETLKTLRVSRGLQQSELAAALNLKQSSIGKYERGEQWPKIDTLIEMADFFDVSLDFLLDREDSSESSGIAKEQTWYFSKLSPEDQTKILEITKSFYKLQEKGE